MFVIGHTGAYASIMKKQGTILIVDDDEDIILALRILLKQHYKSVYTETNPYHLPRLLRQYEPDVILLDMNFRKGMSDGSEGMSWLKKVKELQSNVQVIMITAYSDVTKAVEAVKAGASDFIEKPWRNEKLLATIHAVYELSQTHTKLSNAREVQSVMSEALDQPFSDVIGNSRPMQEVLKTVEKVASTDANVLILGENGVGKEVIARALHRRSHKNGEVFLPVDLGAIPETLFESELFGHKRGAFTGAVEDRVGRFQLANGGTIFLDEIGNITPSMQSKLLQALQTRTITPVGSDKSITVDVRVICATNQPLREMVSKGKFREDLFYRINTVELHLPALRERGDDVGLLTKHFLDQFMRKYQKKSMTIDPEVLTKLKEYHWPGNIRELQHMVERAVILSDGNSIKPSDFHLSDVLLNKESRPTSLNLLDNEKRLILEAVDKFNGNISKAAEALGLTRAALYRRLEKFGIQH